jgi:hypothetical protein
MEGLIFPKMWYTTRTNFIRLSFTGELPIGDKNLWLVTITLIIVMTHQTRQQLAAPFSGKTPTAKDAATEALVQRLKDPQCGWVVGGPFLSAERRPEAC